MAGYWQFGLLALCWLAALGLLLFFLESWFALSGRSRFVGRRASGAYGPVSVFLPMQGSAAELDRSVRSVFRQTYPFIELFLIYSEDDGRHASLAREFRNMRSHIPVRLVPTSFPLETGHDRTRALEQAQSSARGRWYVVMSSDVILDTLAIEHSLEFAGSNELSALALRPGVQCRTLLQRLLAPSMEYFSQMMRLARRRRERSAGPTLDTPYLLANGQAFEEVNRINRMPGILNEAGWNLWSYQLEGLRTFEGDGAKWMWREVDAGSWPAAAEPGRLFSARSVWIVVLTTIMAVTSVVGIGFAAATGIGTFTGASILAFSAVGYSLLAISYFHYARRMRAISWFAPLWWIPHVPAALLTLLWIQRIRKASTEREAAVHKPTAPRSRS